MLIQVEVNAKRKHYSVPTAKQTYFLKECGNKLFIDEVINRIYIICYSANLN